MRKLVPPMEPPDRRQDLHIGGGGRVGGQVGVLGLGFGGGMGGARSDFAEPPI